MRSLERIRSQGGIAVAQEADLANPEKIPLLFDQCEGELGPVDILVNNHTYCVNGDIRPGAADTEEGLGVQLISAARH